MPCCPCPAATKLLAAALLAMLVEVDAATSLVSFGEALLVKLIYVGLCE